MKKAFALLGFVLLLFAGAGLVFGSTVADVAKKEKERREKTKDPAKVFTNQDIADFKAKNKDQESSSDEQEGEANEGEATTGTEGESSTDVAVPEESGQGEDYWRGRYQEAKGKVAEIQAKIDQLQSDINGRLLNVTNYDGQTAQQLSAEIGNMKNDLEALKKDLDAAQQAVEDVEVEGHKAGALPGWFRD